MSFNKHLANKILYIVLGSLLLILGLISFFGGLTLTGILIEYEIDSNLYNFNIDLIIEAVAIAIGIIEISVGLKSSKLPENVIVSVPHSRVLSGNLLLLLAFATFMYFGIELGHGGLIGTWLFLGGIPISYPTGLFPLIFGSLLAIFSMFSFTKIKIDRTDDLLTITEIRAPRGIVTEIEMAKIQAIHHTNKKTGLKFLWIFAFIISVVLLLIDGFSFILNPNSFGTAYTVGAAYLISAFVQLFVMINLIFSTQFVVEIVTDDKLYEFQFFPSTYWHYRKADLDFLLNPRGDRVFQQETHDVINQRSDFKRVLLGAFLIILGIICRINHFYAGEILRFAMYVGGTILVVEGLKKDLTITSNGLELKSIKKEESIQLSNKGVFFSSEYYFKNVQSLRGIDKNNLKKEISETRPRKLTIIDHVVFAGLVFLMGMESYGIMALLPVSYILFGFNDTIITILLIFTLWIVFTSPETVLKVKLGGNCQIPIAFENEESIGFTGLINLKFKNFALKFKIAWQNEKKIILFRIIEIGCAFAVGILVSLILHLG